MSNGEIHYKSSHDNTLIYNNIKTGEIIISYWKILKNIDNQTPELCMEAVKEDGFVLKYAKYQTFEICLEAVKHNSIALQYIKDENIKKQIKEILYSF